MRYEPGEISAPCTLPSDLFKENFGDPTSPRKSGEMMIGEAERMVQSVLSALGSQHDLAHFRRKRRHKEISSLPQWLWETLTVPSDKIDSSDVVSPDTPQYEWWMGTRLIHSLLPELSPFELHAIANQSIVFTDGSETHYSLCLLLCVYALRQCPVAPIQIRWKRWQSLVCETVRLYQHYGLELVDLAVPLWKDHLLPACQHVVQGLPPEAYHVAFFASQVGTTSSLVMRECLRPERDEKVIASNALCHILELLEVVRDINHGHGYSESWFLLHPWRLGRERVEEKNDEVEFIRGRNDIVWWTEHAYRHEAVAGMDTSWDELGMALTALVAFDSRPLVLAPAFIWSVWFPYVEILFRTTNCHPLLNHLPLSLLDNLIRISPEKSLPPIKTNSKRPDSPFLTFQQLSNRLMEQRQIDEDENEGASANTSECLLESDVDGARIVQLMKSLLNCYQPVNQVKIIRKLVHDCPHPGLKAKFMDLLRAVIFEPSATEALWTLVGSFVKEMLEHADSEQGILVNVERLVHKVELYVGAITMIQLWCLVKGRLPRKIKRQALGDFYKVLETTLGKWLLGDMSMPPDDYYRLYLLEGALQQVMQVLEDARKRKNCNMEDSSHLSLDADESMCSETPFPSADACHPQQTVIVGHADIFA